MANEEQLAILHQGPDIWNKWQQEKRRLKFGIRINFPSSPNPLSHFEVEFKGADLTEADLSNVNLEGVQLNMGRHTKCYFSTFF